LDADIVKLKIAVEEMRLQLEAQSFVIGCLCSAWGGSAQMALELLRSTCNDFNSHRFKSEEAAERGKQARDVFSMAITRLNARVQDMASFPREVKR
jgi:hypothetical protein